MAFFDLYDRPLHLDELHRLLWKQKASLEEVQKAVAHSDKIAEEKGWIFLKGSEEIIKKHHHRRTLEKKRWAKVYTYLHYLQWIPFIEMCAVCNNLAFGASKEESDIDLFFVIKNGRLWTTRLLITFVLHILGVRRYGKKIAGRFCLSFFVTEKGSDMQKLALDEGDDVYLAYWTATLIPVIDKGGADTFFQQNDAFLRELFPNYMLEKNNHVMSQSFISSKMRSLNNVILQGKIGYWCEKQIRKILYKRSKNKAEKLDSRASVIISDSVLKFHNIDKRAEVRGEWEEELAKYI